MKDFPYTCSRDHKGINSVEEGVDLQLLHMSDVPQFSHLPEGVGAVLQEEDPVNGQQIVMEDFPQSGKCIQDYFIVLVSVFKIILLFP